MHIHKLLVKLCSYSISIWRYIFNLLLHLFKKKNYGIKSNIFIPLRDICKETYFFLLFPNITSGLLTEVYLECISMAVILQ